MSFTELGLNTEFAESLQANGISTPSDIQKDVFLPLKNGESVIALSKTGTGKTLAYLAPLVQRYTVDHAEEVVAGTTWGLIMVPTRELADQAEKNLKLLTGDKLQAVVIVGGESEKKQVEIGAKAAIYIATPGRFLDLLDRKLVDVSHLKTVVFDEADRILDMGFVNDIRTIRQRLPEKLQLCFFSATIHFGIDEMAYEFGVEAQRIGEEQDELTVEGLDHRVAFVGDDEKFHALANFLKIRPDKRGIVFTNFRERARELVSRLNGLGLRTELLTAQLSQSERSRTMQNFRDNKVRILIASDLASRGLDVQDLDFVINMALPEDSATYLHRVGRTARAGKKGIALSLVGFDDSFRLEALEKFLGKPIERFEFYPEELTGPLPHFGGGRTPETRNEQAKAPYQKHQNQRPQHKPHTPRPHTPHVRHDAKKPHEQPKAKTHHAPAAKKSKSFFGKILESVQNIFGIKGAEAIVTEEKRSHHPQRTPHHRPRSHNAGRRSGGNHRHKGPNRGKPQGQRSK